MAFGKKEALGGLLLVLRVVRVAVVAVVCLLVGVSARHLFDAYGRELIPFLAQEHVEAVQEEATQLFSETNAGRGGRDSR
jgi:hypothetical protein